MTWRRASGTSPRGIIFPIALTRYLLFCLAGLWNSRVGACSVLTTRRSSSAGAMFGRCAEKLRCVVSASLQGVSGADRGVRAEYENRGSVRRGASSRYAPFQGSTDVAVLSRSHHRRHGIEMRRLMHQLRKSDQRRVKTTRRNGHARSNKYVFRLD